MGSGSGHAAPGPVPARQAKPGKRDYSALQGGLVVLAGCAMLVGLSFAVMVALTGPNGWLTRAANTALLGDSGAAVTAYAMQGQ